MSKAEERAFEYYPNIDRKDYPCKELDAAYREVFVLGYHQAEKDLELTWEDISNYISGPFVGTHKEFVDKQTINIKNRLKEIYGEILPRELDEQIQYIVGETYNVTRNRCARVWNVEPNKGW